MFRKGKTNTQTNCGCQVISLSVPLREKRDKRRNIESVVETESDGMRETEYMQTIILRPDKVRNWTGKDRQGVNRLDKEKQSAPK